MYLHITFISSSCIHLLSRLCPRRTFKSSSCSKTRRRGPRTRGGTTRSPRGRPRGALGPALGPDAPISLGLTRLGTAGRVRAGLRVCAACWHAPAALWLLAMRRENATRKPPRELRYRGDIGPNMSASGIFSERKPRGIKHRSRRHCASQLGISSEFSVRVGDKPRTYNTEVDGTMQASSSTKQPAS